MTKEQFGKLERGDIIRSREDGGVYLVDTSFGNGNFAIVRSDVISNPSEWDYVGKNGGTSPGE